MDTSDFYVQDNADIENQKFDAAKNLYQSGDYNGALRLYLDMLNTNASHKLYYEIGRCYYKLDDFTKAESYFTQSVSLDEYKNPSYLFLGNIYYKKQNLSKAIEYWITSYSYKPDDESVCLNLATSYFSKNMKFYSLHYYEKYLKYAKDKATPYYIEIKNSIDEFIRIGNDFYQKAKTAISMNDSETAIQALEYAVKNFPTNFDINFQLGKLYVQENNYEKAITYLKQALCLDSKSMDILQQLSSAMIKYGDLVGAYCCLKRSIPLVIKNQKEYLNIIKATKELESRFGEIRPSANIEIANNYYNDNNYRMALMEYENAVIINPNLHYDYGDIIQRIKSFINPEERIIQQCIEKGDFSYSNGDYQKSNKYFTKVMTLSKENSAEYKLAKSRITNV